MDKIFKPNYNKPMSTTNLVRSQENDEGHE